MTTHQARPTTYKGIQMRSRLEARFAAWMDRNDWTWTYEPECFASEVGQYLPDFEVHDPSFRMMAPARPDPRGQMRLTAARYASRQEPGADSFQEPRLFIEVKPAAWMHHDRTELYWSKRDAIIATAQPGPYVLLGMGHASPLAANGVWSGALTPSRPWSALWCASEGERRVAKPWLVGVMAEWDDLVDRLVLRGHEPTWQWGDDE